MNIVTAATETIVCIPVDIRRKDRGVTLRRFWSNDPREAKKLTGFRFSVQVVQSRSMWGDNGLAKYFTIVPMLVPLHSTLRVISIGRNLHGRPRAMFVKSADATDKFFCRSVTPQLE